MKIPATVIVLFFSTIVFCQTPDSIRVDSVFNYEIKIPGWLQVINDGDPTIFGGTLPAVKGIANAISIRGFAASTFPSFAKFRDEFLDRNSFGKPARFDTATIWYGQEDLIEIENGVKQKVFLLWEKHIYHTQFVLLQTPGAYLLVQFVATSETYDINISKFNEFLAGLKLNINKKQKQ